MGMLNAEDFILFKSKLLFKGKENDPIYKAEVIKNIVQSIALIPNHVNRSIYISELRRQLNIEEEILYSELNKQLITNRKKETKSRDRDINKDAAPIVKIEHKILATTAAEQERRIIKLLLLHGDKEEDTDVLVAEKIISEIEEAEWDDSVLLDMFNFYSEYYEENKTPPNIQVFINHPRQDFQDLAAEFAVDQYSVSDAWAKRYGKAPIDKEDFEEELRTTLLHFEFRKTQKNLKQNIKDMKTPNISEEEITQLQMTQSVLSERIAELSKELGIVVY